MMVLRLSIGSKDYAVFSMNNISSIVIKNIYYMLSYAFQVLKQSNYEDIESEEFDNVLDLFAAILSKGIAQQLKQGLHREYISKTEDLSVMRGKLDVNGTVRNRIKRETKLTCEYDELSEDNRFNQILKTTAEILSRSTSVKKEHRTTLRKEMMFFHEVNTMIPSMIDWSRLTYQRNNGSYKMLMNICYLVLDGLLLTTEKGEYRMARFLDEQKMSSLYERFVREYYVHHFKDLSPSVSHIKWNLDDTNGLIEFLPTMKTDITLRKKSKVLIIDTKYYSKTMQQSANNDKKTLHSNNLYQIYAYVKNFDKENSGDVSGLLLYAKTDELIVPDCEYNIGGNKIGAKTLDLNVSFSDIANKLNMIAESF
jgi:5-methylcytosine-specific restriction enzyme subunit McrC